MNLSEKLENVKNLSREELLSVVKELSEILRNYERDIMILASSTSVLLDEYCEGKRAIPLQDKIIKYHQTTRLFAEEYNDLVHFAVVNIKKEIH